MGPFLFAMALQPIIRRTRFRMRKHMITTDHLDAPSWQLFYLDDGVLVGPHEMLASAAHYLSSPEVRSFGLHLKPEGTRVWWPSPPTTAQQQLYPDGFTFCTDAGIKVLGVPIGSEQFESAAVSERAEEIGAKLQLLTQMEDAHVAFSLARACFGTCRLNHLLRSTPTSSSMAGATLFDSHMKEFATYLAGGALCDESFNELQLPVQIEDSEHPHAGAGLTSALNVAPAAYLASLAATCHLFDPLTTISTYDEVARDAQTRPLALTSPTARAAYERFSELTAASSPPRPTLPVIFDSQTPLSQRQLTSYIHNTVIRHKLNRTDARTNSFRNALTLPGAKDWLKCMPCPPLRTHIHHTAFLQWFSFYARNKRPLARCPRRHCRTIPDQFGDHLLCCRSSDPSGISVRTRRHDRLVRLLANTLRNARRAPVVEPRQYEAVVQSRPDIVALGQTGGEDLLDVAVCHTLAPSHIAKRPLTLLNGKAADKQRRHQVFADRTPGGKVIPIIFAASGGWHPESHKYVTNLVHSMQVEDRGPLSVSRAITFYRFAALLVTANARMLTSGLAASGNTPRATIRSRPVVSCPRSSDVAAPPADTLPN